MNNIAGGDLLQIRVETLVREQEERVTESATWWRVDENDFLDALASLDLKLSVSQWVSNSPFSSIKASASTGLSELFEMDVISEVLTVG